MTHWANAYVGLPWAEDFDCWGLVRRVFSDRFGICMPESAADVLSASRASGWRPASAPAQADDVVLMANLRKQRHVGIVVHANRRLQVLHNDGHMAAAGPRGHVRMTTLEQLLDEGCSGFEFWRRA